MSFFDGLLGIAAPIVGGLFGGPAGAAAGAAVSGFVGGREQNEMNIGAAQATSAFNAVEAERSREFNSAEARMARNWMADEAGMTRYYNALEAEKNREFQSYMSGTAWTRGVADMKNAGLNPMLAFSQGGASSPSGSAASSGIPGGASASGGSAQGVVPHLRSPVLAGIGTAGALAEVAKTQADAELTQARADQEKERVPYGKRRAEEEFRMKVNESDIKAWQAHVMHKLSSETHGRGGDSLTIEKFKRESDAVLQSARTAKSTEDWNRIREKLDRLEVPKSLSYSEFYEGDIGKATPYLDPIRKLLNSAGSLNRLRR